MEVNDFMFGDEFLVRVRVDYADGYSVGFSTIGQHGEVLMAGSFSLVSCELDAAVKEDKPKYDPRRLFKRGDIVRVVGYKGRLTGYDKKIYKVCEDEEESGRYIKLSLDGCLGHVTVDAAYLELVTPVEELEPYKLIDSPNTYNIVRDKETVMTIHKKSHPHAKLAAEDELDRLNSEYLKEGKV